MPDRTCAVGFSLSCIVALALTAPAIGAPAAGAEGALRVDGTARWDASWLELAAASPRSVGAARIDTRQDVRQGFETELALRLDRSSCVAGDCGGGSLGLVLEAQPQSRDAQGRRLVVALTGGTSPDEWPMALLPGTSVPARRLPGHAVDLADGEWHRVLVRQAGGSLEVRVDQQRALVTSLDLGATLGPGARDVEVILQSANAGGSTRYEVRSWRWTSRPAAGDDAVGTIAAHASTLTLVPKVFGVSYSGDVHPIWSSHGCTGCNFQGGNTFVLSGTATAIYPNVLGRISVSNPSSSLVLTKPGAGGPSHGGGENFPCMDVGGACYNTILHWIQDGAPFGACTFSLNPTSRNHGSSASSGNNVGLTASEAVCKWTASSDRSWIHVTSAASGTGSANVVYSVDANAGTSSRSGSLTIGDRTFAITQSGVASCSYTLSATSVNVGSSGGPGSVDVTTGASCNWTATSNNGFLTVTAGTPHTGSGTLSYNVSANGSTSSRSGTLTVAGQTYTVNQAGTSASGPCTPTTTKMCLNGDRFEVSATYRTGGGLTGDAHAVELTADTGYLWFFGSTNVEVVLKVLTGCPVNGKYWVYAGGLTDVEVSITVRDALRSVVHTYKNPLGTKFAPIQDVDAFATCP
jgi:hypothetical protein